MSALTKAQPQLSGTGPGGPNVLDGVISNVPGSSEISTAELQAALRDSSAIILDARPYEEYAVSHIPNARAVPAKPGTTPALYVGDAAEVFCCGANEVKGVNRIVYEGQKGRSARSFLKNYCS
jgi:rhodanese-related sulfurtransferase